jgi:hypothetical protein
MDADRQRCCGWRLIIKHHILVQWSVASHRMTVHLCPATFNRGFIYNIYIYIIYTHIYIYIYIYICVYILYSTTNTDMHKTVNITQAKHTRTQMHTQKKTIQTSKLCIYIFATYTTS